MYADRYAKPCLKPGSLAVAIAINGGLIGALLLAPPELIPAIERTLKIENIPLPAPVPPPPAPEPLPQPDKAIRTITAPQPAPMPRPFIPDPIVPSAGGVAIDGGAAPGSGMIGGTGEGVTVDPPAPVIVEPRPDPRFAGRFQPSYPAAERRAGAEGRVVVRVLVGADGRVKQVERVSASSDAFFEATRRRAIEAWRFTPGTRDGIAVEAWRTMSVSFVLSE